MGRPAPHYTTNIGEVSPWGSSSKHAASSPAPAQYRCAYCCASHFQDARGPCWYHLDILGASLVDNIFDRFTLGSCLLGGSSWQIHCCCSVVNAIECELG